MTDGRSGATGDSSARADERAAERDRLLDAVLAHVPFDGWTAAALAAGARDLGGDAGLAEALYPRGARDAVAHFSRRADRRMTAALDPDALAELRIHERIVRAVETRLDLLAPHREAVRRGLSFLALPAHAALGAKLLYRTVDEVWYAVGDRSADFSFYTKRALLAGVVASTTLVWIDDSSEDGAVTRAFLERRIADVMRLHKAMGSARDFRARAPNPLRILRDIARRRTGFSPVRD